jgi:branched-chain amino acid transport system permease protein
VTLLSVKRLEARHGQLKAVRGISLTIEKPETIALVGANGAGKTTLLRAIAGAHRIAAGRITFKGEDISARTSHARAALGVALVPEGRRLFARLTVEENLLLARSAGRTGAWTLDAVMQAFPNLKDRRRSLAGTLSGGEQQATAIGRALMMNPELLLLDEVSLGLSPVVVDRLYVQLEALKSSGVAMLLVEQDLKRAMSTASRTICMLEGAIAIEGPTHTLTREQVTEAYFGQEIIARGGAAALIFVNQVIQGVLLGGYYALIACGLSFMFGVMGVINLAHGSLAVLSAYALYVLADRFGVQPFLGLALVIPLMALVGWALQRLVLERSARGGLLVPVLSTFGLSIILDNLLFEGFGADTRSLAPYIGDLSYDSWTLSDDIAIGKLAALTMVVAVALLGGIETFLNRTPMGRAIRATAEDLDTVGLVGVNARRVNAIAAAIALATVAVAGAFLGMRATFDPYAGAPQLIFAFEASVIGGAGSLWGTLVGGIVLGVAQSLGALVNPQGFFIAGHIAFLAVLFARLFFGDLGQRVRFALTGGARS